jgi:sRNA-binding protein
MFRSILTLALSVFLLAEASAQTTPATTAKKEVKAAKKQTKASARAAKRAAKQADRLARKNATTVPQVAVTDDGWPPLTDADAVLASANPEQDNRTFGETPVHMRAEDVVYAAPGAAVHIRTGKAMDPYSVRPARKPASGTTLEQGR